MAPGLSPSRTLLLITLSGLLVMGLGQAQDSQHFTIQRTTAHSGFDGKTCWVHARAGVIPPGVPGNEDSAPLVVMTMQKLLLSGSDIFYALNETKSHDGGKSWTDPHELESFWRQTFSTRGQLPTGAENAPELLQPGDQTTVCDFTPMWHRGSQRLLGIGQTVWYRNNRVTHVRPRGIAYAVYQPQQRRWASWKTVALPDLPEFRSAGSGSVQRVDLPGGDVLIPFSFKRPDANQYSVSVCRCRFDGHELHYVEHGNALTIPVDRGLYEPSLTHFEGRYFLTLRNDRHGYVATSVDGLTFDPPKRWTFDDGQDIGNYNTQQHWVTHRDALFLVYTRRGANNDHVFRHRSPLFIAQVDPLRMCLRRDTEQILVPERGARTGNFGVVDISPQETWVTVTEWMQPAGVEQHGSDNSVFVVKLRWNRPNQPVAWSKPEKMIAPYVTPPAVLAGDAGDYASPLNFPDGTRVRTAADWQSRRQEILREWKSLLGEWPELITDPQLETLSVERLSRYTKQAIRFQWTPSETTNGFLLIPHGPGPHPAVLNVFYEPETGIGAGKPHRDFARQLALRGFVTLSIGTTEASRREEYALYHPSLDAAEVAPLSMLGYAAANAWHVLADRADVDSERIGIVGHSFGGKWALFAACLFDRFACAAWSDPGIVFDETRSSINYWEPWYLGYHSPPWRKRGLITAENPARGLYPRLRAKGRDLHELHALMAPRPFLVSGGSEDSVHRWQPLNHTVEVNHILGFEGRVAMTNRPDHAPNEDSNAVVCAFFEHFLKPAIPASASPDH